MNPRIILLALGMFALGTDAFIVAGVLPVIAHETGVSEGLVGQLIAVFSLTYGLGAPVLAAITAHWPRNRVLIGALGLVSAFFMPWFSSQGLLLSGQFLHTFLAGASAADLRRVGRASAVRR